MHLTITITITITISNTSYYYIEGQILKVRIYFCNYSHNVHHPTYDDGVCAVTVHRELQFLQSYGVQYTVFWFVAIWYDIFFGGGGGQYC